MGATPRPPRGADVPDAHTRMLDAGEALFADLGLADVLAGLNVSKVSRRARVTRPTFYAHWPTQADFVAELVGHVLDPARWTTSDEVVEAMVTIASSNDGIVDALRTIAHHDLVALTDNPGFRFEHILWSKMDEPGVRTHLQEFYREVDAQLEAGYRLVLQRWDREPRPPFTLHDIVVVLDALVNGMGHRRAFDPDHATPQLYTDVLLLLLPRITRAVGETDAVTDLVAEVERFPTRAASDEEGSAATTPPAPGAGNDDTRAAAVLDAVDGLAASRAWLDLELDEIARVAGTTPATILRLFGSRAGLGVALLVRRYEEQVAAAADDEHRTPVDALRRALTDLRRTCTTHVGLAVGAVGVAVRYLPGDDPTSGASPIVAHLSSLLDAAQAAGALTLPVPASEVASTLVQVLVADVTMGSPSGLEPERLVLDALASPPGQP